MTMTKPNTIPTTNGEAKQPMLAPAPGPAGLERQNARQFVGEPFLCP